MSQHTTITTSKTHRRNQSCVIGEVIIRFDENLQAIVETDKLEALMLRDKSLSYGDMKTELPTSEEVIEDAVDDSHVNDFAAELDAANTNTKEENPDMINIVSGEKVEEIVVEGDTLDDVEFSELTLAALKDVATEANLPATEWKSLRKADLVEYLKTKI